MRGMMKANKGGFRYKQLYRKTFSKFLSRGETQRFLFLCYVFLENKFPKPSLN